MTFADYARIINSPDPVNPQDLSTKNYVDLGDRTYYCRAYRSAAFTFSATANTQWNPVMWDVVQQGSGYSTGTGLYTCPVTGIYLVRASISVGMTVAGSVTVGILLNGGQWAITNLYQSLGTAATVAECNDMVWCNAGDTLSAFASTSQASAPLRAVASESHMDVAKIGAP